MIRFQHLVLRLLAASAGGAAIAAAFPPVSFWPGAFVGVTLILTAVAGAGVRLAPLLGLMAGVTGHAIAFAWLRPVLSAFTQASSSAVSAYSAVFVIYQGAQLALFAMVASCCADQGRNRLKRSAEVAAAWVVVEWCFPRIIPWSLADGLAAAAALRQACDIAGPYGVSFMVVAISASLTQALVASGTWRCRWQAIMAALVALSAMACYGAVRIAQFDGERAVPTLRVTLVQGRLGVHDDPELETELAWQIYEPLTLAAAGDSKVGGLVIWPETTLRAYVRHDANHLLRAQRLVSRLGQALLLGALDLPAAGGGELNIALLVLGGAAVHAPPVQVYRKRWLLPFAEYVPWAGGVGNLKAWRTTGHFVHGEGDVPLKLDTGITLAPAICFEILRPGVFNPMVREGASLLVNLSDDSWFAATVEPQQHLQSATMRAVETRRWLVRASDSGISAVIDPTGRVMRRLDVGAVGALQVDVPLERAPSLYVRLGDWLIPFCVLLLAAPVRRGWGDSLRRRGRHRDQAPWSTPASSTPMARTIFGSRTAANRFSTLRSRRTNAATS